MKKFLALLAFSSLLFVSCLSDDAQPPVFEVPTPPAINFTSGEADFSKFVSVGNSLTAGFSDNALFMEGQTNSFPNMMASSFAQVGGGAFTIPFMADNLGGATLGGQPILGNRLFLSFASGSPLPTPVSGTGSTEISSVLSGPFNNMGVPGAKSFHLLAPGYGNVAGVPIGAANPYYARMASSPNATVLGDAAGQAPTFFSLWIGNNDILSFATSGGLGVDQQGNFDPSTYGGTDITDPNVFAQTYNGILQTLTAGGAKGVIANIPDVTSIPYFTTVPHNPIPLDAATAGAVNTAYAAYNGGLAQLQQLGVISAEEVARRTISFSEGATNAAVIIDEDLTDLTSFNPALINMRQATADDLMVLVGLSFIGTLADPNNPASVNGVGVPLGDQWVLTPEEQASVSQALSAYNETIAAAAATFDLAFVDANAFLKELKAGGFPLNDGTTVTATFGTGGGFSLDGVHPSPRGYALLANKFLEEIENKYGATLPEVEPEAFTGVYIE
ncbi:G-D-S-L family lipolytic protein [Maribacter algarum]|uniref:G-D-S-L family lipolytic protein n=1 Tax=Maribacter algarum (ex Zhang et al. 2020) TaxID=2578118 RepID=A0A5S3PY14_9FLAO|nr:SGNH/GDSL hydrolase family protein [Maribacter algarum]TMM58177.1 G-D-S-L family lipolytic protein [Maribacter algarum]